MREALAEAAAAPATGDVPIGAIVVGPDGAVAGRGRNRREADADPIGHAEVLALRAAAARAGAWRLDGHTLVVTLEPCPMCAGAVVQAQLPLVVYGAPNLKAGACETLYRIPSDPRLNHRAQVVAGVLGDRCAAALSAFFQGKRALGKK